MTTTTSPAAQVPCIYDDCTTTAPPCPQGADHPYAVTIPESDWYQLEVQGRPPLRVPCIGGSRATVAPGHCGHNHC